MDIVEGAIKFMDEDYLKNEDLFKDLADHQSPHTLFIGCSDSRVVPNMITNTLPGELFVVRNVANIVPPYRVSDDYVATTAAIEYAINELKVKNIVVCGHSNCGGCAALYYSNEKLQKVPNIKKWLNLLAPIKEEILKLNLDSTSKIQWYTERLNIINSIDNLYTYPGLKEAVESKKVKIHGWHFIIETGLIYIFDEKTHHFKIIEEGVDYESIFKKMFVDY